MDHSKQASAFLIMTSALLLLAGCGQHPVSETTTPQDHTAQTARQEKFLKDLNQKILVADPYVTAKELDCITKDFASYFQLSSKRPIRVNTLKFPVQDLLKFLPVIVNCDPGKSCFRGVEVYFGLDSDSIFDVALEMVTLTYNEESDTYAIGHGTTYYRVVAGRLMDQHATISRWQKGQGKSYAANVMVQLDESVKTFVPFRYGRDVTSVVFPFEGELERLITENNLDTGMLDIKPTCEPLSRGANYVDHDRRQGICVVPVGVTLTDLVIPRHEYSQKGADLGSPCPPTCDDAQFKPTGLQPKPGC